MVEAAGVEPASVIDQGLHCAQPIPCQGMQVRVTGLRCSTPSEANTIYWQSPGPAILGFAALAVP